MAAKKQMKISSKDAKEIAQYCTVIQSVMNDASYNLNIPGLVSYSPPKGLKAVFYLLGMKQGSQAYVPGERSQVLDSAVHSLLEKYEKIRSESEENAVRKRKKKPTLSSLVMDAYVRARR